MHGTFVSGSATALTVSVLQANKAGKALKGGTATFTVDAKTKVHGAKKTLAALVAGDRVVVQARACASAATVPATLVALKIGIKGAKGAKDDDEDDEDGGKTTTSATTTTSTTTTP